MKKALGLIIAAIMVFTSGCTAEVFNNEAAISATEAAQEVSNQAQGTNPVAQADENGKFTVGISLLYRQNEYYKDLETTFINEAEKYGLELKMQDANLDLAAQIQQIEDFVTLGVDAIAYAPVDGSGTIPVTEEAIGRGIPVFVFDSKIESDCPTSQIIFDLYYDGTSIAEWALDYIAKNMDNKATIAILDFPAEPYGSVIRANGFQDTIEAAGNPDIKVVSRQDGGAEVAPGMEAMENMLSAHPDINLVYGINYECCAGARQACEAQGKTDVAIVGLGWGIEAFEALENNDNYFKAWNVPAPPVLAENTMQVISDYLNGREINKEFDGVSFILDSSNIKDYDWRSIVALRENN